MEIGKITTEQKAQMLGCSVEQLKRQYLANAVQMDECAKVAASKPNGKYRGATAVVWEMQAQTFREYAQ